MNKLSLIHPDDCILQEFKKDKIFTQIIDIVTKYIKHFKTADDIKFVRYLAILIENLVKKKHNINKLSLFTEIIKHFFPNIDSETLFRCINILEDLLKNSQIKKIPILKYALHLSYEIIKKSFVKFFLVE